MSKLNNDPLKSRWTQELSKAGAAFLKGKGAPPFDRLEDGRHDLRQLAVADFIKNVSFADIDLAGAALEGFGQFGMCTVERCRFAGAHLETNLGSRFTDCDFSSAKLGGAVLRGVFSGCNFSSCNLSSAIGNQVTFTDCIFSRANFKKTAFTHCKFSNCGFEGCRFGGGSLGGSKFENCLLDLASVKNTLMEGVVGI